MAQENLKFCECQTLEEFKKNFKAFNLQNLALQDGLSIFDVTTSNMDGTIIGEMFDHPLRMKALYENNEKLMNDIDKEELMKEVNEEYKTLIKEFINEYGEEELNKSKEMYGKHYNAYDTRR